jgi:hypothetical protein
MPGMKVNTLWALRSGGMIVTIGAIEKKTRP